jgi:transcriptional regulator with GAF, ATPase, and Fis domain
MEFRSATSAPDVQAKILRVLQEREVRRVGGNESFKVDVRLPAANRARNPSALATGRAPVRRL